MKYFAVMIKNDEGEWITDLDTCSPDQRETFHKAVPIYGEDWFLDGRFKITSFEVGRKSWNIRTSG